MATTLRYPFNVDAYRLGFLPGFREDGSFQDDDVPNADVPVGFLDNNFHDPDLDRYLPRFETYDPSVAVIGDAYTPTEADKYDNVVSELAGEHPHKEFIVVPKADDVVPALSGDLTLGVPVGYSDIHADDLGWYHFRGHDVHILGGTPDTQYDAIQKLTQPTLDDRDPANIKGVDWNGFFRPAFARPGEYWTPTGWNPDYGSTTRETVKQSLKHVKEFWQSKGLWPDTEPREIYGDAVEEPDDSIWIDAGGDPITTQGELEHAYLEDYDEYGTLAFSSETAKNWFEYRARLLR